VSPHQQTEQPSSSAGIITVRNDGNFDAQVSIPKSWQLNSQHIIQAQAIGLDNGCYISSISDDYHFSVLGTVNGKLYTFIFDIKYSGPNAYNVYGGSCAYCG
jgi:hypothetical protein